MARNVSHKPTKFTKAGRAK